MSDTDALDRELLAQMREDFLAEAQEITDRLGLLLAQLEKDSAPEVIHSIFREVHTLKGTAGFVGLESTRRLAHKLEDVFGAVRAGRLEVSAELIDIAYAALAQLTAMRDDVARGGSGEADVAPLVERLEAALRGEIPGAGSRAPGAGEIPGAGAGGSTVGAALPGRPAPQNPMAGAPVGANLAQQLAQADRTPAGAEIPEAEDFPAPGARRPAADPAPGIRRSAAETAEPGPRPLEPAMTETTLRVDVETLDTLMLLVGELITARNTLSAIAGRVQDDALQESVAAIDRLTRQLQSAATSVRLVPIERLFTRFTPVVRNLARERGKQVRLVIEGGDTPLDRTVSEQMYDPLIHLLRNALDHGLEPTPDRRRAAKPEEATIRLAAERRGDTVILRVSDDGAGIDPARVRRAAVELGLYAAAEVALLSDEQAIRLIFMPGFSTAKTITELSGRGVGLDVVLLHVRRLRGSIEVETTRGQGTTFVVQLPLTLAILQVLLARVGGYTYALPLHNVRETLRLPHDAIQTMQRREVFFLRDLALPVRRLAELLHLEEATPRHGPQPAVVVRRSSGDEIVIVDELIDKQQMVVKPLSPYLGTVPGVEGAAILPDGSVTLILDLEGLLQQ